MNEPTIAEMVRGEDLRETLLAELRLTRRRLRLAMNAVDTIGLSLKRGLIDVDTAMVWIDQVGASRFMELDGYDLRPFEDEVQDVDKAFDTP